MKWIAILLLLLNAGYFGWSYYLGGSLFEQKSEVRVEQEVESLKVVPTLILLSEQLSATKARQAQSVAVSDVKASEPVEAPDVAVDDKPKAAKPILVCREVGPLDEEEDAKRVLAVLEQQAVEAVKLKEQKISEEKTYWLSLPLSGVSESLEERIKKVEKVGLTTRKMEQGRLAGKVVAGPFISYEVAESYLFRLLAVGVDMAIEPIVDVQFQYWVLVEWMYEPGFTSPSSILTGFLTALEKEIGNELQQNACS